MNVRFCSCFCVVGMVLVLLYVVCVFFFKQKTAYEMRISDWSSDVCSSDLAVGDAPGAVGEQRGFLVLAGQLDHRQDAEHVVQRRWQRRAVALQQPHAL